MSVKKWLRILCGGMALVCLQANAGFLDMPEMEEVPELEEETMLLDLDIPNVRERDPDPQAGPRLNVTEFRVQGIVEFPELGITREALAKRVESLRFELMGEGQVLESGYRLDELGEIADLLRDIEEETKGRHVTTLELQRMVFLMRDQLRERGVTLGMIEAVSDAISNFYRERGFILAKAFIPEQKVRDGVVVLTLLLGELGDVEAENNSRYKTETLTRVFNKELYRPVTKDVVEEGLYLINDLPGLSVQGYFEPGSQVGDTRLHINVQSEERYAGNVRLDNHGSTSTGENRLYGEAFAFNPFGWSDQFQLAALSSFDPENTTYGLFRYTSYILGPRWRFSLAVSNNDFVSTTQLSQTTLEATGESLVSDFSGSYFFKRSRKKTFSASISATNIQTELAIVGARQPDLTVNNIRLGFNFDVLNEKARALHIGDIAIVSGASSSESVDGVDVPLEAEESTVFLTFDYSMLKFLRFPFTKAQTRLLVEVNGQFAGQHQESVNQFSLTGPKRARGFEVNEFFGDDGLRLGAEWVFNFPKLIDFDIAGENFTDILRPYLLTDMAYGIQRTFEIDGQEAEEDVTATFANVGVGFKFNFLRNWKGDISFSQAVAAKVDGNEEVEKNSNLYFSLQYGF